MKDNQNYDGAHQNYENYVAANSQAPGPQAPRRFLSESQAYNWEADNANYLNDDTRDVFQSSSSGSYSSHGQIYPLTGSYLKIGN